MTDKPPPPPGAPGAQTPAAGPDRALIIVWLLPLVFVFALVVVATAVATVKGLTGFASVLGLGALLALASGFCGSFFGFLFGMPRDLSRSAPAAPPPPDADPAGVGDGDGTDPAAAAPADAGRSGWANNNLVEVSDWLTKIVVGIGLVQFTAIAGWVGRVGQLAGEGAGFDGTAQGAFGVSVMLSGFVFGFIITYIYARTLITLIFATAARQVEDELRNKIAQATRIVRVVEEDLRHKLGEVREEVSVAKQEQAVVARSIRAVVDTLPDDRKGPASVLTALYRPAPEGYTEAITTARALLARDEHRTDARLWAYLAFGLGQRYAQEGQQGAPVAEHAQTADEALHALNEALRLDPSLRDWLRSLWNPDAPGHIETEDDLVPFHADEVQRPRFAALLDGTG